MTSFHKALDALWGGFTFNGAPIHAYLSGRVKKGAPFPYITYEVGAGAFGGTTILTAFVWLRKEDGANTDDMRASVLDQIAAAIPEGGKMLTYQGGGCMLYRNSAGFISLYDDPEDKNVLGGRVSYEVHFY